MSNPQVLLLLRAENPDHADRAWRRMLNWEPQFFPSELDAQVNEALRLTATGADSSEQCRYDVARTKRVEAEEASFQEFKRRFSRRGP